MFVTNSYGERLMISRLLQISSSEIDKVSIISQDGSSYDVSKFTFSFLSNLYFEHERDPDKIITSISVENLAIIMNFLHFEDNSELDSESFVVKDAKSLGIELNRLFKNSTMGWSHSVKEESSSSIEASDSVNQSNRELEEIENTPLTIKGGKLKSTLLSHTLEEEDFIEASDSASRSNCDGEGVEQIPITIEDQKLQSSSLSHSLEKDSSIEASNSVNQSKCEVKEVENPPSSTEDGKLKSISLSHSVEEESVCYRFPGCLVVPSIL